jgi:hypothetical protein
MKFPQPQELDQLIQKIKKNNGQYDIFFVSHLEPSIYFFSISNYYTYYWVYNLFKTSSTSWRILKQCFIYFDIQSLQKSSSRREGLCFWTDLNNHMYKQMWRDLLQNQKELCSFLIENDFTMHTKTCENKDMHLIPILNNDNDDLICPNCFASVNMIWQPNYNLKQYQNDIMWHSLWNNVHSYIYWIPEEVMIEILTYVL